MYYLAGAYPTMFALGAAACTTAASASRRVLGGAGCRERRVLASARAAGACARSFAADDRSHVLPSAADRSRGHRGAAHADALRRVRLARARARRRDGVRRVTAGRSRASRDLCVELRRGRGDRLLRHWPSARAQRQQPILSVGTARLRRLGRACASTSIPAKWSTICDSAQVVAHFGTSPYAMPYERNRPIVLCRGMHPPLAAALAGLQALRHRESRPRHAVAATATRARATTPIVLPCGSLKSPMTGPLGT